MKHRWALLAALLALLGLLALAWWGWAQGGLSLLQLGVGTC